MKTRDQLLSELTDLRRELREYKSLETVETYSSSLTGELNRNQLEELDKLQAELSRSLNNTSSLEKALTYCLNAALQASGMDSGAIFLINIDSGNLELAHSSPLKLEFLDKISYHDSDSVLHNMLTRGEVVNASIDQLEPSMREKLSIEGLINFSIFPIFHYDEMIGCLNLGSHTQTSISEIKSKAVEAIAGQLGNIVYRNRMNVEGYQKLNQNFQDGLIVFNLDGNILEFNNAMIQMLGYTAEEFENKKYTDITPKHWFEYESGIIRNQVFTGGYSDLYEKEYIAKDGSLIPVEMRVYNTKKTDSETERFWALSRDIRTEKVKGLFARSREEEINSLFRAAPIGIGMVVNRVIVRVNDRLCEMTGYSARELINQSARILYPTEEEFEFVGREKYKQILEGEGTGTVESRWKRKDGSIIDVLISSAPIKPGNIAEEITFTSLDITERKRVEKALKHSEEEYRRLFEDDPTGKYISTIDGKIVTCNTAFLKLFGFKSAEDAYKTQMQDLYIDKSEREEIIKIIKSSGRVEFIERNMRHIDGRILNVIHNSVGIYDKRKRLVRIRGYLTDNTLRKEAETEQRKVVSIIENSSEFIGIAGLEGNVTFLNEAGRKMVGLKPNESINGLTIPDFVPEEAKQYLLDVIIPTIYAKGRASGEAVMQNMRNGKNFEIEYNAFQLKTHDSDEPTGIAVVIRDISSRKRLEEQLRQSQKMESIGRLAGGIAHDFNNLLTSITGNSELALLNLDNRDPLREDIVEISSAADRAADLTRQLLAFSRKQTLQPKILNINQTIKGLRRMLNRIIGENIDFKTILAKDIWNIRVDPGQIEQVIINLVVNARDAMMQGGALTVSTENLTLDENIAREHPEMEPGDYILLSVCDTGHGMDDETKAQIFDPFFTTKSEGKGTGLGLSTVYGIIRQSEGHIWVYSEQGKGTCFKIYLPVVTDSFVDTPMTLNDETKDLRGAEKILVVEDEDAVRNMTCKILRRHGYHLTEAKSGGDAFVICQKTDVPFDLVITDVVMPTMSGVELAGEVKKIWSDTEILFMSGYTDDHIIHLGVLEPDTLYIQKPFRALDLAKKVREILDARKERME